MLILILLLCKSIGNLLTKWPAERSFRTITFRVYFYNYTHVYTHVYVYIHAYKSSLKKYITLTYI